LLASAYYIASIKEGKPISCLRIAKIFGVSDNQVRSLLKSLGYSLKLYGAKRERNAYDIYAEIIAKDGRSITKLIYDTNLAHSILKRYVKKLLEKGLIVKRREGNIDVYNSTEKGLLYLEYYKRMKELLTV
jgi:predicted transcriptional regulator